MTIANRKDARAALIAEIQSSMPQLAAVYGYLPKSFGGKTPVATVESGAAEYSSLPAEGNRFGLVVGMWVDRRDAAGAEDQLDDLAQALAELVDAWSTAEFSQPSQVDYYANEAGQWRVEWHFISVEWE